MIELQEEGFIVQLDLAGIDLGDLWEVPCSWLRPSSQSWRLWRCLFLLRAAGAALLGSGFDWVVTSCATVFFDMGLTDRSSPSRTCIPKEGEKNRGEEREKESAAAAVAAVVGLEGGKGLRKSPIKSIVEGKSKSEAEGGGRPCWRRQVRSRGSGATAVRFF